MGFQEVRFLKSFVPVAAVLAIALSSTSCRMSGSANDSSSSTSGGGSSSSSSNSSSSSSSSSSSTNAAPTVTSVSPVGGAPAGGGTVTITGTGFLNSAAPTISFGGSNCGTVTFVSSTSLTCVAPARAAGAVTVTVTNNDNQSGSLSNGYTYFPAPTVTSVASSTGGAAGGRTVTITGTGFLNSPVPTVDFGGSSCGSVSYVSSTSLTCSTPAHAAGAVTVTVTNWTNQSGSANSAFTYVDPTFTSAAPAIGDVNGSVTITITGTNFVSGMTVTLDSSDCPATFVSATSVTCVTPSHAAGAVNVKLTNPDGGTVTGTNGYTYEVQGTWSSMATTSQPFDRMQHTVLWTGSKVIVWGGVGSQDLNGYNSGGIYDPTGNSWSPTSLSSAPSGRQLHAAVWTSSKMIIWGGNGYGGYQNTGGVYDLAGDSWTSTSLTSVPAKRNSVGAVWTGSKMIVWGGYDGACCNYNDGGVYDLAGDSWSAVTTSGAPDGMAFNNYSQPIWTGSRMVPYGGGVNSTVLTGVYMYDLASNAWVTTSAAPNNTYYDGADGAPFGRGVLAYTGSKIIFFGGRGPYSGVFYNTGVIYDIASNSWTKMSTTNAPSGRSTSSSVWTGTKLIVWGGTNGSFLNTGGIYTLSTDSWTATNPSGTPVIRYNTQSVWTGSKMFVWGGYNATLDVYYNTGGLFDPN